MPIDGYAIESLVPLIRFITLNNSQIVWSVNLVCYFLISIFVSTSVFDINIVLP